MGESAWVQARRKRVEEVLRDTNDLLDMSKGELRAACTALRDEVRILREHLNPTRQEGDGDGSPERSPS
jgi:hypothetical protein